MPHMSPAHIIGTALAALFVIGLAVGLYRAAHGRTGPPLARGFLRGGRFREDVREGLRFELHRVASCASRLGDEQAARLMERAALALTPGQDLGDLLDALSGWEDAAEPDPPSAATFPAPCAPWNPEKELPVFSPAGTALGFLSKGSHEPESQSLSVAIPSEFRAGGFAPKERWITVTLRRTRAGWETAFPASTLSRALPHAFRAALLLLLALLCAPLALRADAPPRTFVLYRPAELSQYGHAPNTIRAGAETCTVGYAEMVHSERDLDVHVWICGTAAKRHMPERRKECVLLEIVPGLPLPLPKPRRGEHVRACGRWVEQDLQHGWTELHPGTLLAPVEVLP